MLRVARAWSFRKGFLTVEPFLDLALLSRTILGISGTGFAMEGNNSEGIATEQTGQSFLWLRTNLAPKDWLKQAEALSPHPDG